MKITCITNDEAMKFFVKYSEYRGPYTFAICAMKGDEIHGVIALNADGNTFSLGHIWTDGNAHIGSLLYGAAWRSAKAMGYREVII